MADINNVTLVGRLVRDAEARTTKSGKNIAAFTIAVSGIEKEYVDFIDCLAWGKTADVVTKYTSKGKRVGIVGKLHINKYETKDGEKRSRAEVIVNSIQLLSSAEASKKEDAEEAKPSDEVSLDDIKLDEPVDLSEIPF
jgi:single-strand DNA-binding protein